MDDVLKEKISCNTFVDKVRSEMIIDEDEYDSLRELLKSLSQELKNKQVVDKELALILYSMPQMIRNTYLSFSSQGEPVSDLTNRLEDIWMELDELVIECLS